MNKKNFLAVFMGALSPTWAMDPPATAPQAPGASFHENKKEASSSTLQSAGEPHACGGGRDPSIEAPQRSIAPPKKIKRYLRPNANQSLGKKYVREGKFPGDQKHPLFRKVHAKAIGEGKGPGHLYVQPQEKPPSEAERRILGAVYVPPKVGTSCKVERVFRQASKTCIKGHIKNMRLIHSLPKGAKIERITIPLKLEGILKLRGTLNLAKENSGMPEITEAIKILQAKNLKALRRMKDLAIEHLTVEIDVGGSDITQRVLEWIMKNPYGGLKSVAIKTLQEIQRKEPMDFLLPTPMGKKIYPQKKLQAFCVKGRKSADILNADMIKMLEKHAEIKSLRLSTQSWDPFPKKLLRGLVRAVFPHLRALSIQSNYPILKEIKKAHWASQLTSLCLGKTKGGFVKDDVLTGFSRASFPALKKLKLTHFVGKVWPLEDLVRNLPDLQSFYAYECAFDFEDFSALLQGLSGMLENLHLEKVASKEGKGYQLPEGMAKTLQSLTLKNCNFEGEKLKHFFGADSSFEELSTLNLIDNRVDAQVTLEGFKFIFLKKFPKLKELYIKHKLVTAIIVDHLLENPMNFQSLKSLTLSENIFNKPIYVLGPGGRYTLKSEAEYRQEFRTLFRGAEIYCPND